MLFKKIIVIYSENHVKPINTFCRQNVEVLTVKAGGTYSYQSTLKGLRSAIVQLIHIL
jgi:hypothetical protein